jgi:type VI secretion system protein ImpL
MQIRRSVGIAILFSGLFIVAIALWLLVRYRPEWLGLLPETDEQGFWLVAIAASALVSLFAIGGYQILGYRLGRNEYSAASGNNQPQSATTSSSNASKNKDAGHAVQLKSHLHQHYGRFWRHRVRVLLVVGEPEQIEAIAPSLAAQHWLEGQGTVLLYGGSTQSSLDQTFSRWQGLTRDRALDGVVWALTGDQSANAAAMAVGVRHLQALAQSLRWQLPLHLWQVCETQWPQVGHQRRPVGCPMPPSPTRKAVESLLEGLQTPLRQRAMTQVTAQPADDFLLRLSRDLQAGGVARWGQVLAPLLGRSARGVPVRGLWFSLPAAPLQASANVWPADPVWKGLLTHTATNPHRLGWPASRVAYVMVIGALMLWISAMLLSGVSNYTQYAKLQNAFATTQHSESPDQQLLALNELVRELGRLDEQVRRGGPWYQRFGLNQSKASLAALWPRYVKANERLMRDPAVGNLQRQLQAWVDLPAGSPQRHERAEVVYEQLKAYLMLVRPEKADPAFLARVLGASEPTRPGISPGVWQGVSPTLWRFYAEQLVAHPTWRIGTDRNLVAQTRQVLLGQLQQRNSEASLYRQVLDAARPHHPEVTLRDMVGNTDALALFASDGSVPGVFTREAWEGQVRLAIDEIAEARREEIDWVLSDNHTDIVPDLQPDALKARLTERYFEEYASAWLAFLDNLRWQRSDSLGKVIDQLTLMSDVRQSPLVALLNTVSWQGQAGGRIPAVADSLLDSAQKRVGADDLPDLSRVQAAGPLAVSFGPLLGLLDKKEGGASAGEDRLSLQAFLTRVTRVRLKLQQVTHATDPQAMTQAMAQSVFQGRGVDLTDTQAYGRLVAASLGEAWRGVGHTLFVQPLEQAWQRVLQPAAAGLNRQWQQTIVDHWEDAFAGRYPFAANGSDASLPMLGKMIRADSGRIEQFLQRELGGLLRKDGARWVPDTAHSEGLRFDPGFLLAINQLSHLADVLYTDGGMGLNFELQGKAVRDVVQTTFILNGARHPYFNQKESWQRFGWPGGSDHPGASLSWTSVHTGERLFADFQGVWGLIHLLDRATVTPLDDSDSRYRLVLEAPDGLKLTWHLRTELGEGPMTLLKLRDFKLPTQIFLNPSPSDETRARNGGIS